MISNLQHHQDISFYSSGSQTDIYSKLVGLKIKYTPRFDALAKLVLVLDPTNQQKPRSRQGLDALSNLALPYLINRSDACNGMEP
jgi:hypothetical protein